MAHLRSIVLIAALAPVAVLAHAVDAGAHTRVDSPEPRDPGSDDLKANPCGFGMSWGDGTVHTYAPGDPVTIEWTETIPHAGYFRVALGMTGDSALTMPPEADFDTFTDFYSSGSGSLPDPIENPAAPTQSGDMLVYYDLYEQHESASANATYSVTITLPMQTCEQCTLQVVQTMAEAFRTYGTDAHYYQCIDLTIEGEVSGAGGASAVGGSSPMGGGSGLIAGGSGGMMAQGGAPPAGAGMPGAGMAPMGGATTTAPMAGTTQVPMGMSGAGIMSPMGGAPAGGGAAPTGVPLAMGGAATMPIGAGAPGMTMQEMAASGGCAVTSVSKHSGATWLVSLGLFAAVGLLRRRR